MNNDVSYQYYHSNALMVINPKGLMRVLYTPFRVLCIEAVNNIPVNAWVYVEEISSTENDELQYLIYGVPTSYRHFSIPIKY